MTLFVIIIPIDSGKYLYRTCWQLLDDPGFSHLINYVLYSYKYRNCLPHCSVEVSILIKISCSLLYSYKGIIG